MTKLLLNLPILYKKLLERANDARDLASSLQKLNNLIKKF